MEKREGAHDEKKKKKKKKKKGTAAYNDVDSPLLSAAAKLIIKQP